MKNWNWPLIAILALTVFFWIGFINFWGLTAAIITALVGGCITILIFKYSVDY
jgi:hypothetical protein